MEIEAVRCRTCGAPIARDLAVCPYCAVALSGAPMSRPVRGAFERAVDLTTNPIPNASFKPGRMERRTDGVLLNVPAGSSYFDWGEGQAAAREGCIVTTAVGLDADAAFGVIARLQVMGAARTGYGLMILPASQSFTVFHFYASTTEQQTTNLRNWERSAAIRGVGEENSVELRHKATMLEVVINGATLASVIDERSALGTSGWIVRSYGQIARVLLRRLEWWHAS